MLDLLLIAVGSVLLVLPAGRDWRDRAGWLRRSARCFPVAAGLLIWLIGDIERREALLIHALQPWRPAPGVRDRRWPFAAMAGLAIVAILPLAADVPFLFRDRVCQSGNSNAAGSSSRPTRWRTTRPDDSPQLRAPSSRERPSGDARHRHRRAGGEWRRDRGRHPARFDRRLTDDFDIVLFDTRGVGDSGYVDCPGSSGRYRYRRWFDVRPAVIDDFVDACIEETGVDPARLGDYGSAQLAEDIETIRRDLGVERIALYAESYGTVAAQRYAVAHPGG